MSDSTSHIPLGARLLPRVAVRAGLELGPWIESEGFRLDPWGRPAEPLRWDGVLAGYDRVLSRVGIDALERGGAACALEVDELRAVARVLLTPRALLTHAVRTLVPLAVPIVDASIEVDGDEALFRVVVRGDRDARALLHAVFGAVRAMPTLLPGGAPLRALTRSVTERGLESRLAGLSQRTTARALDPQDVSRGVDLLLAQVRTVRPSDSIRPSTSAGSPRLTPRQRSVLGMVVSGLPNRAIAERLGTSEKNVEGLVARLFRAYGAHNRASLVATAVEQGMVPSDQPVVAPPR